jgi:predicted nucleic acid-binding protein
LIYIDTSALLKLVVDEPESEALRAYLSDRGPLVTSALSVTELLRAARRIAPSFEAPARALLDGLTLVEISRPILEAAALLHPPVLRTLDAIHLATALTQGAALEVVVTYDVRLRDAARAGGLDTDSPV